MMLRQIRQRKIHTSVASILNFMNRINEAREEKGAQGVVVSI